MYYVLVVLFILICMVLSLVILLQQGRGGDIASAFGGSSSQAAFGAFGATVEPLLRPAARKGQVRLRGHYFLTTSLTTDNKAAVKNCY